VAHALLHVIARSPRDEAIQNLFAEGFWIASAFAKASADKSLRSQDDLEIAPLGEPG